MGKVASRRCGSVAACFATSGCAVATSSARLTFHCYAEFRAKNCEEPTPPAPLKVCGSHDEDTRCVSQPATCRTETRIKFAKGPHRVVLRAADKPTPRPHYRPMSLKCCGCDATARVNLTNCQYFVSEFYQQRAMQGSRLLAFVFEVMSGQPYRSGPSAVSSHTQRRRSAKAKNGTPCSQARPIAG